MKKNCSTNLLTVLKREQNFIYQGKRLKSDCFYKFLIIATKLDKSEIKPVKNSIQFKNIYWKI